MVVPAGLVNNWHRELNEVFNLDFEVFGSEGDITDRKTNAFAKHDRLIASIDTLKRPARIKRLLDAPQWDLVVFDEAHHLTAYRTGSKIRKPRHKLSNRIIATAEPSQRARHLCHYSQPSGKPKQASPAGVALPSPTCFDSTGGTTYIGWLEEMMQPSRSGSRQASACSCAALQTHRSASSPCGSFRFPAQNGHSILLQGF